MPARIPQKTGKGDVPAGNQEVIDAIVKVFGEVRGPFSILLYSPALAGLIVPLVPFLRETTIVPSLPRMAAVLAAVREKDCHYVWAAQVRYGRGVGVREELIDLLRAKGDASGLPEDERDLVEYSRQLMRTNRVDQALFDRLLGRHGAQWMVELTACINFYALLAGMANAFDVPVPDDGDRLPD